MSETNMLMILLTLSGGLQDAYSYFVRGEVFSNAQTGNIVLMSTYVAKGNWHRALHYLIPVLAFAMGIFIAERLHARFKDTGVIHWRQIIVFTEMVLLCIVGIIPLGGSYDFVANALSSCACAMQVQSFRKVNGYPYASTMCIGNMRNAMESISAYMRIGDKSLLKKSLQYFLTIFVFACGAGIGGAYSLYIGNEFIWISCVLLLTCFALMFIKSENDMMREDM
ncbi:YoaK family protein [Ruminococcus sp.]